jgi:hypothetical protein
MALPHENYGEVFINHFDEGVAITMGGRLDSQRRRWVLDVPTIDEPVPIIFTTPEQPLVDYIYPSYIIRRQDIRIAVGRLQGPTLHFKEQFIDLLDGKKYNESKLGAFPFDITYLVQAISRYPGQMMLMQKPMLKRFHRMSAALFVKDSLGVQRSYDISVEPVNDISSLTDIALKSSGLSMSVMVFAELDLSDPYVSRMVEAAVGNPGIRTQQK